MKHLIVALMLIPCIAHAQESPRSVQISLVNNHRLVVSFEIVDLFHPAETLRYVSNTNYPAGEFRLLSITPNVLCFVPDDNTFGATCRLLFISRSWGEGTITVSRRDFSRLHHLCTKGRTACIPVRLHRPKSSITYRYSN